MTKPCTSTVSRRQFLSTAAVSTVTLAAPTILTAAKTDKPLVVGEGDHKFEIIHKDGGQIRGDKAKWQDGKFVHPHDACFSHDGSIYVAEWVGIGRVSKLKRVS